MKSYRHCARCGRWTNDYKKERVVCEPCIQLMEENTHTGEYDMARVRRWMAEHKTAVARQEARQ